MEESGGFTLFNMSSTFNESVEMVLSSFASRASSSSNSAVWLSVDVALNGAKEKKKKAKQAVAVIY